MKLRLIASLITFFVARLSTSCAGVELISEKTIAAFSGRPSPADWDAAVFLPYNLADTAATYLNGATADITGIPLIGDLTGSIENCKVTGSWDVATAKIRIRFKKDNNDFALDFSADLGSGMIFRDGIAHIPISIKRHIPNPDTPRPHWFSLDNYNNLIGDVGLAAIGKAFADQLAIVVPVPSDFNFGLADAKLKDRELDFKTPADGRILAKITYPTGQISGAISDFSVLFCPSGIWVCGDLADSKRPAVDASTDLSGYQTLASPNASCFIRGNALAELANKIHDLPPEQRTANIAMTGHHGNIYVKEWRDNLLGTAGIHIAPQNDNATGTLTIDPLLQWDESGAFNVKCAYFVSLNADIHIHVDPLIGGGVGTSVGCIGAVGGNPITGRLAPVISTNSNRRSLLALKAVFDDNQLLGVSAKTDGTAKGKFITVKVPSVGIRASIPVPQEILPVIPLITSKPRLLPTMKSITLTEQTKLTLRLKPEAPANPANTKQPYLVVTPKNDPFLGKSGILIGFDIKVVEMTAEESQKATAEVSAMLHDMHHAEKLQIGDLRVTVDGFEFGPNNDIIKLAAELVKVAKQVAEAVNGAIKELDETKANLERTAETAWKDTTRETARAAQNVARETDRAISNVEKQVGRSARDVEREASIAAENTAKAAAKAADDAKRAADKAVKDAANNAKKAGGWIKKTFGL